MAYSMIPSEMESVYTWDVQYLYAKFYSRYCLSYSKGSTFRDENGIFFYYSIHTTFKAMRCGREKAENLHKTMQNLGLIDRVRDKGKGYKIYLRKFIGDCTEIPQNIRIKARSFVDIFQDVFARLEIEHLCQASPLKASVYREVAIIIAELYASQKSEMYIAGEQRSLDNIHMHLDMLTSQHIENVVEAFCEQEKEVSNVKAYIQASLYNVVGSHHTHYTNKVKADQG